MEQREDPRVATRWKRRRRNDHAPSAREGAFRKQSSYKQKTAIRFFFFFFPALPLLLLLLLGCRDSQLRTAPCSVRAVSCSCVVLAVPKLLSSSTLHPR